MNLKKIITGAALAASLHMPATVKATDNPRTVKDLTEILTKTKNVNQTEFLYKGKKLFDANPLISSSEAKIIQQFLDDLDPNSSDENIKAIFEEYAVMPQMVESFEDGMGMHLMMNDGDPMIEVDGKKVDIYKDFYLVMMKKVGMEHKRITDLVAYVEGDIETKSVDFLKLIKEKKAKNADIKTELKTLIRMLGMYAQRRNYIFNPGKTDINSPNFKGEFFKLFDKNNTFMQELNDISGGGTPDTDKPTQLVTIDSLIKGAEEGDLKKVAKLLNQLSMDMNDPNVPAKKKESVKNLIGFNTFQIYNEFDARLKLAGGDQERQMQAVYWIAQKIEYVSQMKNLTKTIISKDGKDTSYVSLAGFYGQSSSTGGFNQDYVEVEENGKKMKVEKKGLLDKKLEQLMKEFRSGSAKQEYLEQLDDLIKDIRDNKLEFGFSSQPELEVPGQANMEAMAMSMRPDLYTYYLSNLRRINTDVEGNDELLDGIRKYYSSSELNFEYLSFVSMKSKNVGGQQKTDLDVLFENINKNHDIKVVSFNLDLLANNYTKSQLETFVRRVSNLSKKVVFYGSGDEKIYTPKLMATMAKGSSKEIVFRGLVNESQAAAMLENRVGSLGLPNMAAVDTKFRMAFREAMKKNQTGNPTFEFGLTNAQAAFRQLFKIMGPQRKDWQNTNQNITVKLPRLVETQSDVVAWFPNGLTCNLECPNLKCESQLTKKKLSAEIFNIHNLSIGLEELGEKTSDYRESLKDYKGSKLGLGLTTISDDDIKTLSQIKYLTELSLNNENVELDQKIIQKILDKTNVFKLTVGKMYDGVEGMTPDKKLEGEKLIKAYAVFPNIHLNNITEVDDEARFLLDNKNVWKTMGWGVLNEIIYMPNLKKITINDMKNNFFTGLYSRDGGEVHLGKIKEIEVNTKEGKILINEHNFNIYIKKGKILDQIFKDMIRYDMSKGGLKKLYIDGFLGIAYKIWQMQK